MKRIFLLLLVLILFTACISALADGEFILENGSVQSVPEGLTDVVIPAEVNGEAVRALSGRAVSNNEAITSLTLPEGLRLLEQGAVYAESGMTSLTLPDTLQVIGPYNIWCCHGLTEVTVPASVMYIGSQSFNTNDGLRSVTFLGLPPVIADETFQYLPDECVIYVPDDYLSDYILALPEGLTVMASGRNAVVVDQTLPESDFDFDPATGTITGYHGNAWAGVLPASIGGAPVTAIGNEVFADRENPLSFLRLPEGLTSIGEGGFDHANLYAITFPSTLKVIGDSAFYRATKVVPYWNAQNGVEVIGAHAFEATEVPGILEIPFGVREIGANAFYNDGFSEIYFPETVESVGDAAFAKSTYTKYIAFAGNDLPTFGEGVFDCQEKLADVDIGWQATRVQFETACAVFADMGMTNCTVWRNNPSSTGMFTTADGQDGQYRNGFLVKCTDSAPNITVYSGFDDVDTVGVGESCFENCQTVERFYPHHCDWFTTFGARSFLNSSLKDVEIFDSVTTLGDSAFAGTQLTEVTIPDSVTSVGSGVFANCASLTGVTVFCDPDLLPDDTFAGSPQVTVTVPDEVSVKACKTLAERLGVNVTRPSGIPEDLVCPYPATDPADFWIDSGFNRLDHYVGYELNLVLPQEKDGVALTMLSGNTLTRARSEDGSAVELPVRSVVVPEKYTEVVYNAFNDLPDPEVIVIYAKLPQAFSYMFSNCPNLRVVIFANGVDKVNSNAFINCPALETVYLGPDAEIAADAFNACGAMNPDTVSAVLPDIDALLTAVKADPLPAPEPEPEPEMPEAEPITDPNANVYLGTWDLQTLTMEGMTVSPADLGMNMSLIFTEDGLVSMLQDGEGEFTVWRMEGGAAFIVADGETFAPLALGEDGSLTLDEGGVVMVFVRGEEASAPVPASVSSVDDPYAGDWHCIWMLAGGIGYDPGSFGGNWDFVINADGTGVLYPGGPVEGALEEDEYGVLRFNGATVMIRDDGRLQYGSELSGGMIFSLVPGDTWNPDTDTFAVPGAAAPAEIPEAPVTGQDAAPSALSDRIGMKFTAATVTVAGTDMDASMLGGEYSVTFREDGSAAFVMVGTEVPGLTWTADDAAFHITYFDGTDLAFIATPEGFDMDFYGSMLLHFVPAQ